MGVDLYLVAEKEIHQDEISLCSRELANEVTVLAELGEGTLLDYVSAEEDSEYHEPTGVLAAVKKSVEVAQKLDESEFLESKDVFLDELNGLQNILKKAVEVNVKVCVNIC